MKKYLFVLAAVLVSCTVNSNKKIEEEPFWLGADLGWITEYEANGYNFYNNQGQKREATALMKELG